MKILIKRIEDFLAYMTDAIVAFMKKVFINNTDRLLKFIISLILVFLIALLLRIPFYILELIGTYFFGFISSTFLFKLFHGIWMVLLIILYLMAIFYLICLVARRYFDKPKDKNVDNLLERIYTYYPTIIKFVLYLIYIWLILLMAVLFICFLVLGSLVWHDVSLVGCTMTSCGLFLILLYISDVLHLMIKKVGVKNEN